MNAKNFQISVALVAIAFTGFFCAIVIPPLIDNPDIFAAFAAGFVNPYASGYSADVISCWLILAIWIVHEAKSLGVRYGWLCLVLGLVPGVAVGFAVYLLLRSRQVNHPGPAKSQ